MRQNEEKTGSATLADPFARNYPIETKIKRMDDFVASLGEGELHQIIRDYNEFQLRGGTGNSLMRARATEYSESVGIPQTYIVRQMELLAYTCYRYFYKKNYPTR